MCMLFGVSWVTIKGVDPRHVDEVRSWERLVSENAITSNGHALALSGTMQLKRVSSIWKQLLQDLYDIHRTPIPFMGDPRNTKYYRY